MISLRLVNKIKQTSNVTFFIQRKSKKLILILAQTKNKDEASVWIHLFELKDFFNPTFK